MPLFKTTKGIVLQRGGSLRFVDAEWDGLVAKDDLHEWLTCLDAGSVYK